MRLRTALLVMGTMAVYLIANGHGEAGWFVGVAAIATALMSGPLSEDEA